MSSERPTTGREAIVAGLVEKREWVKPSQRRHYGTNPYVEEQPADRARVVS